MPSFPLSHLYLSFLAEMDTTKKAAFRSKVDEYIRRAEELKDPAASTQSTANDYASFSKLCEFFFFSCLPKNSICNSFVMRV